MSNKIIGGIIALLVVAGGIFFFTQKPATNTSAMSTSTSATGKVIFSISDAAMDMSAISEVNMTVSSMSVHSEAKGWVTVSSVPHTYKLLELNAKNESQLFADFQAPVGTYDSVRLDVDKIVVVTRTGVTKEAKLPSNELKIESELVVNGDATSSINFDFLADKSLHLTGNGNYVFAPVVHVTSESDTHVTISADGVVSIFGGRSDTDATSGMDIDGSVKTDFQLGSDAKLDIVDGAVQLHNASGLIIK